MKISPPPPPPPPVKYRKNRGFTLIELSIVLVIIGLIIGGILVGQDLIKSAEARAEIAQIDKYNSAVNTFYGKYNAIPGDISNATEFGFAPRGQYRGEGDGNGLIEDYDAAGGYTRYSSSGGECLMFWVDLSAAGLIDGGFSSASSTANEAGTNDIFTNINLYLPAAKIGNANYIYVWSGGLGSSYQTGDGFNYYSISQVVDIGYGIRSNVSMSVNTAYSIDKKMDDGLPQSGNVQAFYLNWGDYSGNNPGDVQWAEGGGNSSGNPGSDVEGANAEGYATTAATPGSANTCYDNNGNGGTEQYSTSQNGGTSTNCALSFKMISPGR